MQNRKKRTSFVDLMGSYREFAAPPRISERVECLWLEAESQCGRVKRVIPDGCADIIYVRGGRSGSLRVVGAMTRYEDFAQLDADCTVGVRFRPGMWDEVFNVSGEQVTDRVLALEDLWSKRACELLRQLDDLEAPTDVATVLMNAVPPMQAQRSPLQKAIKALELSRGELSLDEAAREAGFGARQFRRLCPQVTGLPPKLLARILRFRHATELLVSRSGQHAGLAYECGYSDQSHLIAEFQEFAGRTPREWAADVSHRAGNGPAG